MSWWASVGPVLCAPLVIIPWLAPWWWGLPPAASVFPGTLGARCSMVSSWSLPWQGCFPASVPVRQKPENNPVKGPCGVGILIAEKLAQNVTEDNPSDEHDQIETKWINLECRPRNIAIGVFYGPQENEKIEKIKSTYDTLNYQITQRAKSNEIIIAGDFNAKLEIYTATCRQKQSRNGKILNEIIENNNLIPANLNPNHEMWTRVNRNKTEERSVIDYIMITQQISRYIKMITVDEEGNLRKERKKRNWPQYTPNVNQNQRPQKTIFPRKMENQQQRGMGKIQRSYKTSLLKQQNKNRQLPRSRKGNKKHNEEHSWNKKNQNRQDQTNQQPYDKGKKI